MSEEEQTTDDGPLTTDDAVSSQKTFIEEESQKKTNEQQETENPDTQNSEFLTQNMEVHHHTHPAHGKKTWKAYFWEFLMLFLAVFCGFLAENIREHVVEDNRAKEFSKSLLEDLKNDNTAINEQIKFANIYIVMADSLLGLSKTTLKDRNAAKFSFYTRFAYWTSPISWNRATFEQIKNSGSLRYFKNVNLLKKLLEYDALVNDINAEAAANTARGYILLPLINSIIDPTLHHELSKYFLVKIDSIAIDTREQFFSIKTESLENKRSAIKEMLNMVVVQQRNLQFQINTNWQKAQLLATELINDIKKEYSTE
ncbi:MAG: hypothetical protein ABIN36_08450 [Ferruginibacter sp.]